MNPAELIIDLIATTCRELRTEIQDLSPADLAWQPDARGNAIGITVWHCCRWLDLLAVQALQDRPAQEETWFTAGWAEKTGYDPRGIGYLGLGALTGYSWEEAGRVPALSANEHTQYLDQVGAALQRELQALGPQVLDQRAPGLGGGRNVYGWVRPVLTGIIGHLGEIRALKALKTRQQAASG